VSGNDVILTLLREIRDEIRSTRIDLGSRMDATNRRLDGVHLGSRIDMINQRVAAIETTLKGLVDQRRLLIEDLGAREIAAQGRS
jgi:hypothetical protein